MQLAKGFFMHAVDAISIRQILIALCCCIVIQAQAQAPQNVLKKNENTFDAEKQLLLKQIELQSETIKGLEKKISEERQFLVGQLDRHLSQFNSSADITQKSLDRTIQFFTLVVGAMVAMGVGLLYFLFGKSLKEINKELSSRSEQLYRDAVNSFDVKIEKAMGDKIAKTEIRIDNVNSVLDDFSAYKQRRFAWVLIDRDVSIDVELGVLEREGIREIHSVFVDKKSTSLLPDCDVVIFSHDGSESAIKVLGAIVSQISERSVGRDSRPVFLIIYTFINGKPIRLEPHQMEPLQDFRWYQLASFPMTLITVAKNLIR